IWDYGKDQAGLTRSVGGTVATAENIIGRFGAELAKWAILARGGIAGWAPVLLGWVAVAFVAKGRRPKWLLATVMVVATVAGAGLFAGAELFYNNTEKYHTGPGGSSGNLLYGRLMEIYLGKVGSGLILGFVYLGSLLYIISPSLPETSE